MSLDLWKVGTRVPAGERAASQLSGQQQSSSEPTLYEEMIAQYGAIVDRFFNASGTSLGRLEPVVSDGVAAGRSAEWPALRLDTELLSVLLGLYYAEGWSALAPYDDGWRRAAYGSRAPGGTEIRAVSSEALEFYGLTRELVTVTISCALSTITELCSGRTLQNLEWATEAVRSSKDRYGFDAGYSSPSLDSPGKSASVDVGRPEVSAAIDAFLKAEAAAVKLKDAAYSFAQLRRLSDREPDRPAEVTAVLQKGLTTSAAVVKKYSTELAASMASLVATEPLLCAWVDHSARAMSRPTAATAASTLATALKQLDETLSGLPRDHLDTTVALKHREFYPGWVSAVLSGQPIPQNVIPMPKESPAQSLINLALSRPGSPVWTAVACPELVDSLLIENEGELGEVELVVLSRLSEDLATRRLDGDTSSLGALTAAVGLVSALLGLVALLVAPPVVVAAAGIAEFASVALSVVYTSGLFDELARRDVESIASSVRPTELLQRLGYTIKDRGEVSDGAVKSIILAMVSRGTSSIAGFRSAFRALDATQDAETVLRAVVGDEDGTVDAVQDAETVLRRFGGDKDGG